MMSLSKQDFIGVVFFMVFVIIGINIAPYATSLLGLDNYVFQPNGLAIVAEDIIGFGIFFSLLVTWLSITARTRAKGKLVL